MKKPIPIGLHILLFSFILGNSYAQEIDTVLIRQFSYSEYNAGITNYSGVAGEDGLIFFSNSQGVLTYDGSEWELIKIGDGLPVISLLYDKDTLYIGSNDEFGYLSKENSSEWVYTSLSNLYPQSESIDDIWQILKTDRGIYFQSYSYILFYDGTAISKIDIKNAYIFGLDDLVLASSFYDGIKLLSNGDVIDSLNVPHLENDAAFSILPARANDEYLLFTSEHGGFILTLNPLSIQPWEVPVNDKLKDDGFYHGIEYRDSLIICSTWDKGVIIFNKKGEFLKQVDIGRGLPDRSLLELFIDENENIWIPSRSGIYEMRLSLNKVTKSFKPKTTIKRITTEIGTTENLSDIHDPSYLVFDFTTPGLNKEDLEYSFFLAGHDEEWSAWSKQYLKEYTGLSNGNYTFSVKARVIGTTHESAPGSVSFNITLPWYKHTSSYIIAATLLIGIVILLLRIRASELNKAKIELERVVEERTKELVDEREKLKTLNEELVVANSELDNFVYRSSHDLVAPLKSLRGLMMVTRMETKDPKLLEYISMMENSALKLEKFINSIMEYSINSKSISDRKPINLDEILNEIDEEIKFFDKYSAIEISREIDNSGFVSDPKRVKIVMSNLITNAIKYHNINQDKPMIKIRSYTKEGSYYIDVKDNGLGISEELVDKVFDMFYRASETSEGSGLGLYIVKDTMKKLNGQVYISSTINKGSTFSLKFPLN